MNVDEESSGMEFLVLHGAFEEVNCCIEPELELFGVIARIVKMKKMGKHNKSFSYKLIK